MVSRNRDYPFTDYPSAALSEDVLAEVVDLRARGHSWEDTARAVEWEVGELRRAIRHDPNYAAAYALAEREVQQEADAEGMQLLRKLMADKKPRVALDAAKIVTRYLSERRREETHLEVERLRAAARAASADARRAKGEATELVAEEEPEPASDPERERRFEESLRKHEREYAEKLAREVAQVYLWGGCHEISNTPPDHTDTPLRLLGVFAPGAGKIHWAITDPVPTHPTDGPFLKPPGCRPPAYP